MGKWEKVRLEEVCIILDHMRVPVTASNRKPGKYPYYGANGIQGYIDGYIFDDDLVLLAEDGGNFGSVDKPIAYQVSGKCWVNNHAHVLKPKEIINVRYLCYSLMFYDVTQLISGTTRAKLNQAAMRRMLIPLPPLPVQQQIADVLDCASVLIEKRKAQIEKLDLLIKSQFMEMFGEPVTNPKGWEVYRLSEITSSRLGKMLDAKQQTGENQFPYLANFNVQWFQFDFSELRKMDFDRADQEEFELKRGDLLICEGGEIGRCAIWNDNIECCFFQKALHRVRCNSKIILPIYLSRWFYFRSKYNKFSDIVGQATIAHLPGIKLKELKVMVPPLSLQNEFAEFVQQVESQKLLLQQSLAKLEQNYKSLMQKCFRGEIF